MTGTRAPRVVVVPPDDAGLRSAFAAVPHEVYAHDRCWAPRSEDVVDERFEDAAAGRIDLWPVVAIVGDRPVARAAAIREASDDGWSPEGWVGLLECLPDAADAGVAVVQECLAHLHRGGATHAVAPRTDALRVGLQVSGFSLPQTILTAHNPATYAGLLAAAGLRPTADLVSFRFDRSHERLLPALRRGDVAVRAVRPTALADEIPALSVFQESVFGTEAQLRHHPRATAAAIGRLLPLADPELVLVAETTDGAVVGLLVCLPDVWQDGTVDRARLVSLAVHPDLRRRGVATALVGALGRRLLDRGYVELEASWVVRSNTAPQRLARRLHGRPGRTFRLYGADLGAPTRS